MSKVVQLHLPPLTDIPGRLRWLADELDKDEKGVAGEQESCLVIFADAFGDPSAFSFGEEMSASEEIGILHRCATQATLAHMMVEDE